MLEIIEVSNNSLVNVYGVPFNGVSSIIEFAKSHKDNNGVYVGYDSEGYPCFDSEDYASENRYYWNFVFAKSLEEVNAKLDMLKDVECQCNYRKLNEDTPVELCPMIYFGGDTFHPMQISVCEEISIGDNSAKEAGESFFSRIVNKYFS